MTSMAMLMIPMGGARGAGADIVLGMLPLARELLRMGAEVVLVANEDPAINDVTASELRAILREASEKDSVIKACSPVSPPPPPPPAFRAFPVPSGK
jgi:Damage-control phosphatase ARMT1-like domain